MTQKQRLFDVALMRDVRNVGVFEKKSSCFFLLIGWLWQVELELDQASGSTYLLEADREDQIHFP